MVNHYLHTLWIICLKFPPNLHIKKHEDINVLPTHCQVALQKELNKFAILSGASTECPIHYSNPDNIKH